MKWIPSGAFAHRALRTSVILIGVGILLILLPFSVQRFISSVIQTVFYSHFYGTSNRLADLVEVYEINGQLKRQIAAQNLELAALREYMEENVRLRNLLGFKDKVGYELIPAEIVALDPKRRQNAVISETNPDEPVASNLPVVNVDGLVGKTTSVLSELVTIELLTSPNCRAAARDANTRVLGIVSWKGGRRLVLDNVPLSDSVNVGDTIITSGLGGIFPENLPIGTISSVERGQSPFFKTIIVAPFVDFGALDELMILKKSE